MFNTVPERTPLTLPASNVQDRPVTLSRSLHPQLYHDTYHVEMRTGRGDSPKMAGYDRDRIRSPELLIGCEAPRTS
jgi:hypothetical protein